MSRYSPVAPAAIRIQVLPVGRIERCRFHDVLHQLQQNASIVKLADVPTNNGGHVLSPSVFPEGSLLFNYTTSPASQQEQQLVPYELFREPLLILGVADGLSTEEEERKQELKEAAAYLRERHSRVVHRHLLLLQEGGAPLDAVTEVRNSSDGHGSSFKAAIREVAARFLIELTTYTKAMQASPTVQTPGQPSKSLQRTGSVRDDERRPISGYTTPTQEVDVPSSTGEEGSTSRPPSRGVGSPPPATSFDMIRAANRVPTALARSDSNSSNRSKNGARASSQDRVSAHGFGPSMSQEKTKNRGKARVGIVIGHIHMMAGHWNEALRMLVEHTNVSRKLSDNLWHAKGLEGILVCMLLLAWAGLGFQIPSICYPTPERSSFAHASKLSVTLPTDFRPAEVAHQAAVGKLSLSLPELLKHILGLYRSAEGSLELSPLVLCEVRIRFCDLLATLYRENGELNGNARTRIVERPLTELTIRLLGSQAATALPRSLVASMLTEAQPNEEESIAVADHIQILAGIGSVYSYLGMDRKSGMIMKEMVDRLTAALLQARKVGAAEAGIHPAASLSTDAGADSILAIGAESGGIRDMIDKIAKTYGIELLSSDVDEQQSSVTANMNGFGNAFGGEGLKSNVMHALLALCEASPDPYSVLRLATSSLRFATASTALDFEPSPAMETVSKNDQIRNATAIGRTVGVSKHLGLPDVEADYWDPYLVRGVSFAESDAARTVIRRTPQGKPEERVAGNPLLYDPNANRLSTTAQTRVLLVRNEPLECRITMQNPLETSVDIETLILMTEGAGLDLEIIGFVPFTLNPLCFQQVSFSVSPTSVGDLKVTGCRIKVAGCREQLFPIAARPWVPSSDALVKLQGQEARETFVPNPGAEHASVSVTAIDSMPSLEVESLSVSDATMMLLDGERQKLDVVVRNTSPHVSAAIYEIRDTQGMLELRHSGVSSQGDFDVTDTRDGTAVANVRPGESLTLSFNAVGKAGVSEGQLAMYYRRSAAQEEDGYARVVSVPLRMTVDTALQVQHADVEDDGSDGFILSFDLRNDWPRPLAYNVETWRTLSTKLPSREERNAVEGTLLSPGEVQRVAKRFERWQSSVIPNSLDETREELLRRINVDWRTWAGNARWGQVDFTSLALAKEHLEVIRGRPSRVRLEHVGSDGTPVKIGTFITVRLSVSCDSMKPGPLLVQLQSPQDSRSLGLVGVPHRILSAVPDMGEAHVDFMLCPMMSGVLQLDASAKAAIAARFDTDDVWHTYHTLSVEVR